MLDPFKIDYVAMTHSILEPNGLRIETPAGVVLHTGDWKIDENPLVGGNMDVKKLKKIGDEGVIAMICDSTNIFNPGRAGSESDVRNSLLKIMEIKTQRILVTSFASNVARMESIFYCAKKTGRSICLVGRSMNRIYKAAKNCGYLKGLLEPLEPRNAKRTAKNKIVYLATGSQGEPMGAMNRIVNGIHPEVFLESGDCVIFSSKIIPGNEKKLYQLQNIIVRNNIEIISEENAFVHVSGHPNRDDLKDMYNWIRPNSLIPVHGEHRHMREQINFAKEMKIPHPIQVENGDIVKFSSSDAPNIYDKAPNGRLCVDGIIPVEEDSSFIKERKNIAGNGFVDITIIITSKGTIHKKPILNARGLPIFHKEDFLLGLEEEILNLSKTFSLNSIKQNENLIDGLKKICRKYTKEKTGKKPITNINVVRI